MDISELYCPVGVGSRLAARANQLELARLADNDLVSLGVDVGLRDAGVGVVLEGENQDIEGGGLVGWLRFGRGRSCGFGVVVGDGVDLTPEQVALRAHG